MLPHITFRGSFCSPRNVGQESSPAKAFRFTRAIIVPDRSADFNTLATATYTLCLRRFPYPLGPWTRIYHNPQRQTTVSRSAKGNKKGGLLARREKHIGLELQDVRPAAVGEYNEHVPYREQKQPKQEHLNFSS